MNDKVTLTITSLRRTWLGLSVLAIVLGIVGCGNHEPVVIDDDELVIGDNPNTSGNSFWHGVSKKFDQPELQRLYDELNGPGARAKLQQYVCPDSLPPFTITVVLLREGEYQERGVRLQMTPPLYKKDGRIESGVGYLLETTVHALDTGKPIDYGYRSLLDGTPRTPVHTDVYHEPPAGNCPAPNERR